MFTLNDQLVLARQGLNLLFEKALSQPAVYEDPILQFTKVVTSTKLVETYPLDLINLVFREWKGARRFRNGSEIYFQIKNKPFESSIAFDRDQFEDNELEARLGDLNPRFLAAFQSKQADAVAQLLNNGQTTLCYDGQFFFDTDHPVDDPNNSGSLVNWFPSTPLTRANLLAVDAVMRSRPVASDSTDVRLVNPTVLAVPQALRATAEDILNTTEIVDVSGNRIRNSLFQAYKLVVSPRLTDPAAWFLADLSYIPTVTQVRKNVEVVVRKNPQLDNMFHHRQVEIGADGRFGAGYGMWQGIAKAKA